MIALTLAEIAAATGGRVAPAAAADVVVDAPASLDSRAVEPGGLFAAVAGERVDGHDYAAAALAAGAAGVLGSRPVDGPSVVVDDVVVALGRLARHVLDALPEVRVLALTGSQGKTGTKDYLSQILARTAPTVATAGNLNNELGVPLTALRVDRDTRFAVIEMGARGIGHIAYLCEIAPPRVGAVLNVGSAHIGEFGSVEAIALGKGELVEALGADGVAVLNADDPRTAAMAARTPARVLDFGADGEVAVRSVVLDELGRPGFELRLEGAWHPVRLRLTGEHQVPNAAAAAAMALAAGVGPADIVAGLEHADALSRWRMEIDERADGLLVLNDAYNASPASTASAVRTLAGIGRRSGRRTVAVLGEMLELGEGSEAAHRAIGAEAAREGVGVLLGVGEAGAWLAAGAREAATPPGVIHVADTRDGALRWLGENVSAPDAVLVKASRGVQLELVAQGLLAAAPGRKDGEST